MKRQNIIFIAFAFCSSIALITFGVWQLNYSDTNHADWQLCRLEAPQQSEQVIHAKQIAKSQHCVARACVNAQIRALVPGLKKTSEDTFKFSDDVAGK